MKIAISSQGKEKDSLMDSRFGRCQYFCIYNTEDDSFRVIANTAINSNSSAGIEAANLVLKENIDIVITGNIGPNANEVLKRSNKKVFVSEMKKISEIINEYKTIN
ncbi:MAG: NifB/NifX family molybdenum-iron cluster-binding protein [Bacilli bacterium]